MIKKIIIGLASIVALVSVYAGTVSVGWDLSTDPAVNRYVVYGVSGTNTTFAANNTNATVTVTVTNGVSASVTNLLTGAWTFTARALTTNGIYSANAPVIWTNIPPSTVVNFRFLSAGP